MGGYFSRSGVEIGVHAVAGLARELARGRGDVLAQRFHDRLHLIVAPAEGVELLAQLGGDVFILEQLGELRFDEAIDRGAHHLDFLGVSDHLDTSDSELIASSNYLITL